MIQVAQIIFILSVLVILHEFGHYIAAKIFKVRVEKFYLFMDPGFSILKKKIGETEWGIGWLPIGGYVKISGMIDESMDLGQMKQEPQPWEFRSKPAWQRLIIMMGGIIVNILLAWFIYTSLFATVGQKYISTEVVQQNGLSFSEVGKAVGFKNGDKIISVDDQKLQKKFNWLLIDVLLSDKVKVERDGKQVDVNLTDEQIGKILGDEGKKFMGPRLTKNVIDSVLNGSIAQKVGLIKNDKIIAVNNIKITFYDEFIDELSKNKNNSFSIDVLRNNTLIKFNTKLNKEGKLGIMINSKLDTDIEKNIEVVNKLSVWEAFPVAINESYQLIKYNFKQFKLILKPKTGAYKQVKSPIGIARMLPDEWNWEFIWSFTALFSIGLAFMNCLPIPGLDGGHALFTILEMISGRKLSDKSMGYVQGGGMIVLLTLMTLSFGKDIYQLVSDKF